MAALKLNVGDFGDEVARLHEALKKSGFAVAPEEIKRKFFGPSTRAAVSECQNCNKLETTGFVDEATNAVLSGREPATRLPNPTVVGGTSVRPAVGVVPGNAIHPSLPKGPTTTGLPPAPDHGIAGGDGPPSPAGNAGLSGRIVLEHGLPAANVTLRIYQRGFGGAKTLLAEVKTGEMGDYALPSSSDAANVEVHALGVDGREVQLSETKFGLQAEERLDLIAPSALQPAAAEFTRLAAAIAPHTGGTIDLLKEGLERGNRRDFSYLASTTGWDAGAVALAADALTLEAHTNVPAGGLYAMARAGLPLDMRRLANVSTQTVATALRQAAHAGIVDAAAVDKSVQAFGEFSADYRFNNRIGGAVSAPKDFIAKARVADGDRAAFAKVIREEKVENLWQKARESGVSESGIQKLQLQGKLAYLTFNNVDLAAFLETKVSSNPLELIELGFYDEAAWKDALRELAGGDAGRQAALIPSIFRGRDLDERTDAYSGELARRVRQMDPHAVTVDRIAKGRIEGVGDREGVGKFLKNATTLGFRLGKTPLSSFVRANGAAVWNGVAVERQGSVLDNLRTLSALYSVSPSDESMSALLAAGFTSATGIAMHDYESFHERVQRSLPPRSKAGDKRITQSIFWKAQQQSATVFNVFDGLKRLNSASYAPGSTPGDAQKRDDQIVKTRAKLAGLFPTLETLFGSVDYCECDQCQSVLSPAAYLVDLLHFIDPNNEAWDTVKGAYKTITGVDYTKRKPFDVLNDRRPDIKNIALTCENTNVALPYIDLVNEVLEQLMMSDQTPPAIEAYDVGDSSSGDLLAEPQNILWSAYVGAGGKPGLRDLVYPLALPFDLPLEMVRAFLKQLDLPLWRLRECLLRPTTLGPSAPGRTDGWTDVWFERLGFAPTEILALTSAEKWYTLFGYSSSAEALKGEGLRNGKTLARRLGVTYKELVELVRTRFINPEIESLIVLHDLGVDANTVDRYFGEGPALTGSERSEFEADLQAQGIQDNDLRPLRAEAVRKATVILRSPSVGCDFAKTTLALDQDPVGEDQAIAMVLLKMNVFIRMQRKLGWDIHELDRVLMALMPGVPSLTMATWPEATRTALIYLAHIEELRECFEDRLSREEICVLWSDIPTQGVSCLYQRMFLSPAVLGRDPAFKKRLGRSLDGTAPIAGHVDGIRQALQLTHEDIESILVAAAAPDRLLTIQNLSILMRHSVLAKGLDLPVADLLSLLNVSARKPFSALDVAPLADLARDVPWNETLAFAREVALIREAGTDVAFVERMCRHRGVAADLDQKKDPALVAVLGLPSDPAAPEKQAILLVQTLAAQLSAPGSLVNHLSTVVLKDIAGKPLIEAGFSDPTQAPEALRRLRKALDLAQSLGITEGELAYITGQPTALNPNDLPTAEVFAQSTAQNLMKGLGVWLEFVAARNQFGRSERLLAVLAAAKGTMDSTNTLAAREKTLLEALAALTGRKTEWLEPALHAINAKSSGGSVFEVSALAAPRQVLRTIESLKCFVRLGLQPSEVVQFANVAIDDTTARKVRSSVKGRYSPSAWRRLVKPIFDTLRKKQRDALVAYLTNVMAGDKPRYGDTAEKLFEYLLLDPGMEPVVIASRIQLAISSVQLFVQRCLMNLEYEGVDPQIIDNKRWAWMRRYRVWEVNRKMFIWPENLLDSEFRDDKTHLFQALEGKLLEGDVNDDLVRNALYDYLKGLEVIARLEMLTMYFEPGISADGSIVHVVGRTLNAPYKYFYRKASHGMWTPWEPIDVGIEGDHLVLTAWRGRMYLFWISFLCQAAEPTVPATFNPRSEAVDLTLLKGKTRVKLQLHWVEYAQGKWVNRTSTADFLEAPEFGGLQATSDADKRQFFVRAVIFGNAKGVEDDDLEIHVTTWNKGYKFVFFSKLAPPRFDPTNSQPQVPPFGGGSGEWVLGLSAGAAAWDGKGGLRVKFVSSVTQNSETGTTEGGAGYHGILSGGDSFRLLFPSNENLPVPARTPPSGVGRPAGFVFGPQNARHVVYRSSDGSIYDLFRTRNGWFYQSPSADADSADPADNAEPAASDPHGYGVDEHGTLCLAYCGTTKVHELVWSQLDPAMDDPQYLATGWRVETLYEGATPAEQPTGRPFGGMFLPRRGVVFRTKDGKLFAAVEIPDSAAWERKELNAGLPRAASDPTGLLMTKTELAVTTVLSRHIFYVGADGDVYELRSDVDGQTWTYANITQGIPGAVKPAPGATPAAYAFPTLNTLHVVYRGSDDRIHELWSFPGSWNYNPIGAPFTKGVRLVARLEKSAWNYNAIGAQFSKATGDPAGYVAKDSWARHVVYRGEENEVVDLCWYGVWRESILTKAAGETPKARSDVAGYSFEPWSQYVVYFDPEGRPRELRWNDGGWRAGDYELQNPFPDPLGPLVSPFFYQARSRNHTFFVEPNVVETMVHEWTEWIVTTREYFEPALDNNPLVALNPQLIPITPSGASIIKVPPRVTKGLIEDGTMIRTRKGTFGSAADIAPGIAKSSQVALDQRSLSLVDLTLGRKAKLTNLRNTPNRGGSQ